MENGQGSAGNPDHLDYCCQLVSELYGKPDISRWTNSDYVRLGYILYKRTNVQISPNTLKRIFGKIKTAERYYPQRATRDALACYIGYKDWENFKDSKPLPVSVPADKAEVPVQQTAAVVIKPADVITLRKPPVMRRVMIAAVAILAVMVLFSYKKIFLRPEIGQVRLICKNPLGDNPHSAIFVVRDFARFYDPSDDYTIDFGDSRKMRLRIGDTLYSHYYEVPGRYSAIIKRNQTILDTAIVYLTTSGWTATAKMMYDTTRVYPVDAPNLFAGGKKSISIGEISRAGIDTNRTFFVDFINTHITDIDGDNFDFFVNLKTSSLRPGVRCSQVRLTLFGESSKHLFDVMKPGCVHWTDLRFSDFSKNGETDQMNFLGADLSTGGTLELKVVNKHARLFINSKQVYEADYVKPLKKIYGVGITFSGIGTVNSVVLKDLKTGRSFDGNF